MTESISAKVPRPSSGGKSFGRATGLLEKQPGLVDFRLRYHPAIDNPDPILLGGQLGRGRQPAHQRRGIGQASRLLGSTEEAGPRLEGRLHR